LKFTTPLSYTAPSDWIFPSGKNRGWEAVPAE
jgi:hypothetical protein